MWASLPMIRRKGKGFWFGEMEEFTKVISKTECSMGWADTRIKMERP